MDNRPPKLARFQLRDLFWLVLVVGLGLGWWLDHRKLANTPPPAVQLPVGRYQLVIGKKEGDILVDTATGDSWVLSESNGKWWLRPSPSKR